MLVAEPQCPTVAITTHTDTQGLIPRTQFCSINAQDRLLQIYVLITVIGGKKLSKIIRQEKWKMLSQFISVPEV